MRAGLKQVVTIALVILCSILISSCDAFMEMMPGQAATEAPKATANPLILEDTDITAEGRLVPKESLNLAFATGGQIEEAFVEEGDQVKKGDVLARLKGSEQLAAQVAAAEYELFAANQALEKVDDDLDLLVNQALQKLNDARQEVHDLERKVSGLNLSADQTDIDLAYTQLIFAEDALDRAEDRFEPYKNRPETNLTRARLQVELAEAEQDYEDALRKYNALTGTPDDFDQNQTFTDYDIAQGKLEIAQKEFEKWSNGPDPNAVADAEARIAAAEVQLAAAEASLVDLDLVATIDGTVVDSSLVEGKHVQPGIPVIHLVDFSEWFIDTENLTEIEVVDVFAGQEVIVVPDSLPELELSGEVISISDTYEEKRGDITYTARIVLSDFDPRLRWGMTVIVTFLEGE